MTVFDPVRDAPVIGLVGAAGSGKSTVRSILLANRSGMQQFSFAIALRAMVTALIRSAMPGDTPCSARYYLDDPDLKNTPQPWLLGMTPRYLMQTLGTEWGRNTIDPDIWVKLSAARLNPYLASHMREAAPGPKAVYDDVRFQNEADMIRALCGVIVRVERPGNPNAIPADHASESEAARIVADMTLVNDGTKEDLQAKVLAIWPPTGKTKKPQLFRPRDEA